MSNLDQSIADYMLTKAQLHLKMGTYTPVDDKTMIILGGQPGAGKSTITDIIEKQFNGNILILNGDDVKLYFPNYTALLSKDPDATAKLVQPYSNFVIDNLKQEAMARNLNILVEGTMRTATTPLDTIHEAKQNGYRVEGFVIAANYLASRISCIERYERDRLENGAGRSVPQHAHDETYKNIPNTLQEIMKDNTIDNLKVVSRNGQLIADYRAGDDVVGKYIAHRDNVSPHLSAYLQNQISSTYELLAQRNAPTSAHTELHQIKHELDRKMQEFQPDRLLSITKETSVNDVLNFFKNIDNKLVENISKIHSIDYQGHQISLDYIKPRDLANSINQMCNNVAKIELNIDRDRTKGIDR